MYFKSILHAIWQLSLLSIYYLCEVDLTMTSYSILRLFYSKTFSAGLVFSRNRVFSEKYRPQIKTMQCNLKKSLVLVQYDALPDLCMAMVLYMSFDKILLTV